jgi:SAM-dependent methyltransferase
MSRPAQAVADHYKRRALGDVILAALTAAGKDIEHLTPDDLAPVDEFHSGGRNATMRLAQLAQINGSERVLDVGCGIGGPSRYLASRFGCRVTGLDLTADFVALAGMLAQRTRLSDKVSYRQGDALDMPFADASFDLVWSQNAAMNIADRDRLYAEMRRVLTPSGRLALQEIAAGPGGEPFYPTPWAGDKSISFWSRRRRPGPRSSASVSALSPGRTQPRRPCSNRWLARRRSRRDRCRRSAFTSSSERLFRRLPKTCCGICGRKG